LYEAATCEQQGGGDWCARQQLRKQRGRQWGGGLRTSLYEAALARTHTHTHTHTHAHTYTHTHTVNSKGRVDYVFACSAASFVFLFYLGLARTVHIYAVFPAKTTVRTYVWPACVYPSSSQRQQLSFCPLTSLMTRLPVSSGPCVLVCWCADRSPQMHITCHPGFATLIYSKPRVFV